MEFLWSGKDLLQAIKGDLSGSLPKGVIGISIDSRSVQKGDLFVALKGEHKDGHDYIEQAITAGASLIIVQKAFNQEKYGTSICFLRVSDTLEALEHLGHAARRRSKAKIIAVTGSVGKTTTKFFISNLLKNCGRVHSAPASFNNHIGVPLTLARMPLDADFGVFEIGMNHLGEIRELVKMVQPHLAVITKIGPAHLKDLGSLENIVKAKSEIFESVVPGGSILLNKNDRFVSELSDNAKKHGIKKIYFFGFDSGSNYRYKSIKTNGLVTKFSFFYPEGSQTRSIVIRLNFRGDHMVKNVVAALSVCHILELDMEQVFCEVENLALPKGRGNQFKFEISGGFFTVIDETYNANPVSMSSALKNFKNLPLQSNGRKISILGDMLELGIDSEKYHCTLLNDIINAQVDLLFLIGENMYFLYRECQASKYENVFYFANISVLYNSLKNTIRAGDGLLLKGSNQIGLDQIICNIQVSYRRLS